MDLRACAITRLASISGIDLTTATDTTALFTVPDGYACIITDVIFREASTAVSTAEVQVGFNSPGYDNVSANTVYSIATDGGHKADLKEALPIGTAGQVLTLYVVTGQAATIKAEVFGYLIPS